MAAPPPLTWQWEHPRPQGNGLASIAYGKGRYVAVGERGMLLVSTDSRTWTVQSTGGNEFLGDVAYQDGRFVAVGSIPPASKDPVADNPGGAIATVRVIDPAGWEGVILTSEDGITWTTRLRTGVSSRGFRAVAHGNGRWVAMGGRGDAYLSDDGLQWRKTRSGGAIVSRMTFGAGQFVAVGELGLITTSADGETWTGGPSETTALLYDVAYGGTQFVAVGVDDTVLLSPDGRRWTAAKSGTAGQAKVYDITSVVHTGGRFLAVAYENRSLRGWTLTSPDGSAWTRLQPLPDRIGGLTELDGALFALGWNGRVYRSTDGNTWTRLTGGTGDWLNAAAFGGGAFVAVGVMEGSCSTIYTDRGNGEWQLSHAVEGGMSSVAYGAGRFVAVGGAGIFTSPDGLTWQEQYTEYSPFAVTYGRDQFVAVSAGDSYTSPDGLTWTRFRWKDSPLLSAIAYGNGTYIAVGDAGVVMTSPDGVTWTKRASGSGSRLTGVAYAAGHFIAVSRGGEILRSQDGSAWQTVYRTGADHTWVGRIGDEFLATTWGSALYRSADGITWTKEEFPTSAGIEAIAAGGGRYVAVGLSGTILAAGEGAGSRTIRYGEPVDPVRSTIAATVGSVPAGRGTPAQVLVTVRDSSGRPLPRKLVQINPVEPDYRTDGGCGLTDERGEVRLPVSVTRPGSFPLQAQSMSDGVILSQTVVVTATACGQRFPDVAASRQGCAAIEYLAMRGVIGNSSDGRFQPDRPVTRAELAKMLAVGLGWTPAPTADLPFPDARDHWAAKQGYLQAAIARKALGGFPDGTLQPDAPVTGAQLVKIVAAAAGLVERQDEAALKALRIAPDAWFAGWIGPAREARLIGITAPFGGNWTIQDRPATREEAAMRLTNLLVRPYGRR